MQCVSQNSVSPGIGPTDSVGSCTTVGPEQPFSQPGLQIEAREGEVVLQQPHLEVE